MVRRTSLLFSKTPKYWADGADGKEEKEKGKARSETLSTPGCSKSQRKGRRKSVFGIAALNTDKSKREEEDRSISFDSILKMDQQVA
tara:strand:+ start:586 stop:846 length:261 start_codon:yes stop_codon:yes gene_type:complete